MLRILRNITVNIMASFIRDRDERHKFRNKYKIKSKFRKLIDDNIRLFNENKRLLKENKDIIEKLTNLDNIIKETRNIYCGWPPVIKQLSNISIHPSVKTNPVYLSIACISKNEGPYLREWIEYHKIVGVERFYFYDNESEDNTRAILEPYINDGTVVYHYIEGSCMQLPVYHDAVLRYANQTYWLAIIDLDEFIVPNEKNNVADFLKDYEQYPGVVVNWVAFDSNGHETKPTEHGGLVTANYTRIKKESKQWYAMNRTIKSIVHPRLVAKFINPHQAVYKGGMSPVTEDFEPIFGPFNSYCKIDKIQLNHYYCKSREEFIKKIERGNPDRLQKRVFRESILNLENTEYDFAIQKYLPELKRVMGIAD